MSPRIPAPAKRPGKASATPAPGIAPTMTLESLHEGHVCGVDEAGRGPWAGPVYAAAVILDARRLPKGVNDSKKLTAKAREEAELEIKSLALAWAVAFASVEEIAELNILHATGRAMHRAVSALNPAPHHALVDGNYHFPLPCAVKTVVKGDALSLSIAAASILAKTARDRVMVEMETLHPGYGFASHKGYGAPTHIEALRVLGPSPIHRMTWAPLRLIVQGGDPEQASMVEDALS